jgi:hypothetical protein
MRDIDLDRAVADGRRVVFRYYSSGALWYATEFDEVFPVYVLDAPGERFPSEGPARLFTRWIREWNSHLAETHKRGRRIRCR